ncbi:polyphosphate kinase 2 [Qipengyuania xiapuensis]|uniref:ADP/GDP-polyphosphate phosphotransferase n=1 Tax=Qipengyuania xiapuensis TaxID=2867236 RepID=A0ABX8ZW04_9SPHN|nr:polyphosphate kinase 2 [Qipengyuania xiapuensis]QZD91323.1 polyphosphate kinase 2 [Qipengyuania xiapuensis]
MPLPIKRKEYEAALEPMREELVAMARWARVTGQRIVVIFEGRDTAGKGGAIRAVSDKLNPRQCHVVALGKPTEDEQGQWYFQRYVDHLPTKGEIVLFDRSWYNRAGVEKVMGFASDAQVEQFLDQVPTFEKMLVDDGILLFKYWLGTDQERQEERLRERLEDPLKRWKLSPIDLAARDKYDAYTEAREEMLRRTHTAHAPWTLVDFNDQKLGRLTLVRDLLDRLPDMDVDPAEIEFPDLGREPREETYGVIEPIAEYRLD